MAAQTDSGRLFLCDMSLTENARSPALVFVRGMSQSVPSDERRRGRKGLLIIDDKIWLMDDGQWCM